MHPNYMLLLLFLLLCLFQTFTLFTSADRSETADHNNLGNFLSCFKPTDASFKAMKSFHYFTVLSDYPFLTFSDHVHTIRESYIV